MSNESEKQKKPAHPIIPGDSGEEPVRERAIAMSSSRDRRERQRAAMNATKTQ
jgi:hypothetical protein